MKIVRVLYKGTKYRAYRTPNFSGCYTLLDVPWGWECGSSRLSEGYIREFKRQKQWNILVQDLKIIKEIYLGGE